MTVFPDRPGWKWWALMGLITATSFGLAAWREWVIWTR